MLDTTRTLTGQEVVFLLGDKDDAADTYTLGTSGNISSWIQSINPQRTTNSEDRTPMSGGTNPVTVSQPTGTMTIGYQLNLLGHPDVLKVLKPMETENSSGRYVYPFKVVYGVASSDNHFEKGFCRLENFTPGSSANSLVKATVMVVVMRDYEEGQTTGLLS